MRLPRLLVVLAPLVLPALLVACGEPTATAPEPSAPPTSEGPERPAPSQPERGPTSVRFALDLPDGAPATAAVSAWWRKSAAAKTGSRIVSAQLEDGTVTVEVPHGPGLVKVRVPGCVVFVREVVARRGRVLDGGQVEVAASTPLLGRVVDADGAPVPDAFIFPEAGLLSVPLTSTDDDGAFSFDGLPDGEIGLRVECDRFVRRRVSYDLRPGCAIVVVTLDAGGLLEGSVAWDDDVPVPGAYMWITDLMDKDDRDRMAWPSLGDDARFSVHLAPGRYLVHALEDGQQRSAIVIVEAGGTHEVSLRIPRR